MLDGKALRNGSVTEEKIDLTGFTPSQPGDVVPFSYVQSIQEGLKPYGEVAVATTTAITNILADTITVVDGYTLQDQDDVLVKDQADPVENGIYTWSSTTQQLVRADRFDDSPTNEAVVGTQAFVVNGATFGGYTFFVSGTASSGTDVVIGTDPVIWTIFSSSRNVQQGDGILVTGNTVSVNAGDGLGFDVGALRVEAADGSITVGGTGISVNTAGITSALAGNGLTANSGAIDLGGTLTSNVLIEGPHSVSFGNPSNKIDGFTVDSDQSEVTIGNTAATGQYNRLQLENFAFRLESFIDANTSASVFTEVSNNFLSLVLEAEAGNNRSSIRFVTDSVADPNGLGIRVTDAIGNKGMYYFADYSAANTTNDRWIVDKGYVDGVVTEVGLQQVLDNTNYPSGTDTTATGLNISGADVFGTLNIDAGSDTIVLSSGGAFLNGFNDVYNVSMYLALSESEIGTSYIDDPGNTGSNTIERKNSFSTSTTGVKMTAFDNLTSTEASIEINHSGSIILTDALNSGGAYYAADYSAANTANPRWIPDKAYADSQLGGQNLASTVTNPAAGQDGFLLAWNNTNGSYELIDQASVSPTLNDGSGTVFNSGTNAYDLGGSISSNADIDVLTTNRFSLRTQGSSFTIEREKTISVVEDQSTPDKKIVDFMIRSSSQGGGDPAKYVGAIESSAAWTSPGLILGNTRLDDFKDNVRAGYILENDTLTLITNNTGNLVIQDERTTKTGIRYLGFGETNINTEGSVDYSTLAFNSLVPKKYVDDAITSGSFTLTDGSGTTASGSSVNLGGTLSEDFILDGSPSNYNVRFGNPDVGPFAGNHIGQFSATFDAADFSVDRNTLGYAQSGVTIFDISDEGFGINNQIWFGSDRGYRISGSFDPGDDIADLRLEIDSGDANISTVFEADEDSSSFFWRTEIQENLNQSSITLNPTNFVIGGNSSTGAEYEADYSAANTANPRWIPDKAYVDAAASGVTLGIDSVLAQAQALTANRTLDQATFGLNFIHDSGVWLDAFTTTATTLTIQNEKGASYNHYLEMTGTTTASFYQLDISNNAQARVLFDSGAGALETFDNGNSNNARFRVDSTSAEMAWRPANGASGVSSILVNGTAMTVTDSLNSAGLVYAADYSAANAANDRWLVDKGYVDSQVVAATLGAAANTDRELSPSVTSGNGATTGLTITSPPIGLLIVSINGLIVTIGDGVTTKDGYFSADGGTTAKTFANIASGDTFYWNGINAGYDLAVTDVVDFIYLTY